MSIDALIIVMVVCAGFGMLALLMRRWITQTQSRLTPDQLIGDLLQSFDRRSLEQTQEIRQQSQLFNQRLQEVQKHIGEFSEIGRSMRQLQDFLRSPKLRGSIGEEVLADLITQMFPRSSFHLQYAFRSGVRVDAAIKTDAGILPIDAKFPLEQYQVMVKAATAEEKEKAQREFIKDIKQHLAVINQKYIVPNEGTLDFALMYVPSEAVYYELVQIPEVMTFAKRQRVYPVSPTTLYAHLQTILLSFAGKKLEDKTQHVFQLLRAMNIEYEKTQASFAVLGKHITNAYNQAHTVTAGMEQLGQKLKASQAIDSEALPEGKL